MAIYSKSIGFVGRILSYIEKTSFHQRIKRVSLKDDFSRLYLLQLVYRIVIILGWSFILFYLYKTGYSSMEMILFMLILFSTTFIAIFFQKPLLIKKNLKRAQLLRIIALVLLAKVFFRYQIYISAVLIGLAVNNFWMAFNIRYYMKARLHSNAFMASILHISSPIANLFIPALGGLIVYKFGFSVLFVIAAVLTLLLFPIIRGLEGKIIRYDLKECVKNYGNFKYLTFVEGFWEMSQMLVIPLITFTFIERSTQYGIFLSMIALGGVFASLTSAKLSDKRQNRAHFIYPFSIMLAILIMVSSMVTDYKVWVVLIAAVSFFRTASLPIMSAIILDVGHSIVENQIARTYYVNIGRITAMVIVLVTYLLTHSLRIPLAILGVCFLFYPLLFNKLNFYPHTTRVERGVNRMLNAPPAKRIERKVRRVLRRKKKPIE